MRFFTIFALTLLMTSCAVTKKENFNSSNLNSQSSVKVISEIANEELNLEFVPSTGGAAASAQYGFIGALVGSAIDAGVNNSRAKTVEEKIQPFRVVASSFDMRQQIIQSLESGKNMLPWQGAKIVTNGTTSVKGVDRAFLNSHNERYLIHVQTRFHLKPATQVIELITNYSVWDKENIGNKKVIKPIYANNVTYQSFPHNATKRYLTPEEREKEIASYIEKYPTDDTLSKSKKAKNQKKVTAFKASIDKKTVPVSSHSPNGDIWLKDDGKLLLSALTEGVKEIADIVVADLSGALALPSSAFDKNNKTATYIVKTHENGRIIERSVYGGFTSRDPKYPLFTLMN
jgi:hypothetical protein